MKIGLGPIESKFVLYLETKGFERVSAQILSVAVCRRYCLSRDEFIAALEYYIVNPGTISTAIDDLLKRGLLTIVQKQTESFIEATEPWDQVLLGESARTSADVEMIEMVNDFRKQREFDLAERIGWAGRIESRQAFRDAIAQARYRIRLGVYSSKTVFLEIADAIKTAMINNAEMRVEIMMLSPRLAGRIEDNPNLASDVITGTKKWLDFFVGVKEEAYKKGHRPTLQVRWVEDEKMAAFHRGLLIDDRLWILNIHRPGFERGIDGIVYRGFCSGKNTNIFTLLDHYWNTAWKSGINPNPTLRERLRRVIDTYSNTILGFALFVLSLPLIAWRQDTWAHFAQGAAVAKIADDLPNYLEDVGRFLEKVGKSLQDFTRRWRKK